MSPAIPDSGPTSRVTVPRPWGRFSWMTSAASRPLSRKQRAVEHCPTLITDERHCCTSISTGGPISLQLYPIARVVSVSKTAHRGAAPFLPPPKGGGLLERFS